MQSLIPVLRSKIKIKKIDTNYVPKSYLLNYLPFTLFLIIFLFLSGCSFQKEQNIETLLSNEGVLNLEHEPLVDQNITSLNGEWAFYWNELISPNEVVKHPPVSYMELPRIWNDFEYNKESIPSFGYATYHLSILLNEKDIGKPLAIYIPYIHTSYSIYINGELKGKAGKVGISKDDMEPKYLPQTVFFSPSNEKVDIVIHISNFHHTKGGIVQELILGDAKSITDFKESKVAKNLFLFGSFLIISIYHMAIFIYRRSEIASLVFSLFCLLISIRMLVIDQIYLVKLFPNFSWVISMKLEYLSLYGGFVLFLVFLKSIYPIEVPKTIYRILLSITIFYTFIMIITSPSTFTNLFSSFTFVALICVVFFSFIFIKATLKRREGSLFSCIAGLFFVISVAFDILYSAGYIKATGYLLPIGFFIFIFSQSLVLSIKYAKTFLEVNLLNNQLKELNESLEEKVQRRTEKLKLTMKDTATALAEKSALEERARLVRDIHDTVGHTLTSIIVQIEAGKRLIHKNPESSINRLNASQDMIRSGLDEIRRLLRILRTDDIKEGFIDSLKKLIQDTEYHTNVNIDENIEVNSVLSTKHQHVLFRALQEGLTNGIRHGKSNNFKFQLYEVDSLIFFHLSDDGKGTNVINKGIGLDSMKERVYELHGTIEFSSKEDQGFSIEIHLPLMPNESIT